MYSIHVSRSHVCDIKEMFSTDNAVYRHRGFLINGKPVNFASLSGGQIDSDWLAPLRSLQQYLRVKLRYQIGSRVSSVKQL